MQHILLVDDEPEVVHALSRVLRKEYHISKAFSAEQALELLREQPIDLILSDIRMPHVDGIELLTQIKSLYPGISRVLLSGYADMEQSQAAISNHIAEIILAKPWDNFELKTILKIILRCQHLEQANRELQNENVQLKSEKLTT